MQRNDHMRAAALAAVLALSVAPAVAQQGYGATLSVVYNAHQRIVAMREACSETYPDTASANDAAYAAWRARHKAFVDEIEFRFDALIRGASTNEQDYSRNYGKYHGAVMADRQEYRKAFIAQPREDTARLCREFPGFLQSAEADLAKAYAPELKSLRALRPMPGRAAR